MTAPMKGSSGHPFDVQASRAVAERSFKTNAAALTSLADRLDARFDAAVSLVLTGGRVIVSGVGKSGHIGRKLSATFASLGTPSVFVHATEAMHGDFGMVCPGDVVMLISQSGETEEVVRLIPFLRRNNNPIIAITGNMDSRLARHADAVLDASVEREACPLNLAPTTSTIVALALGDAVAMAVSQARDFGPRDFARYHPGGKLGERLMTEVQRVMRRESLPICRPDTTLRDVLPIITAGRLGTALVMDGDSLVGVITDGDVRRALERNLTLDGARAHEVMTLHPVGIRPDASVFEADELMRQRQITVLVVREPEGPVLGMLKIHDR